MSHVFISGGTGYVGRFIVEAMLAAGYRVTVMGQTEPPPGFFSDDLRFVRGDLEPGHAGPALFGDATAFVHAAFHHAPGKYRGGEGSDPETFRRLNLEGTLALFAAAKRAGVQRAVLLSSRAVYGTQPSGAVLSEDTAPHLDTLYGEVKLAAERGLARLAGNEFLPVSLRATGIYGPAGPGRPHKWADLFGDFEAGRPVAPRVGTEVHGDDLAAAVRLVLETDAADIDDASPDRVFNVSDILLDRRDLLASFARKTGCEGPLPPPADASRFNVMDCTRLHDLGWRPRGALDLSGLI
jgi:nucleoside-diphosphate-sugar epimerase